jgi:hypothetical protein
MNKSIIITVVVALLTAGAGFFGGIKYQQNKRPVGFGQFGTAQGLRNRTGGNPNAFRPVNGEIIESDTNSITVKMPDGSSKIVIFNDKTVINKAGTATPSDLKVGEKVAVFGQTNSDGSVTAQNIQLNPVLRDFPNPSPTNP